MNAETLIDIETKHAFFPPPPLRSIANSYGNWEVHKATALPAGVAMLSEQVASNVKLAGACRACKVDYLRVVNCFRNSGSRGSPHWHPVFGGIVVYERDAWRILHYLFPAMSKAVTVKGDAARQEIYNRDEPEGGE